MKSGWLPVIVLAAVSCGCGPAPSTHGTGASDPRSRDRAPLAAPASEAPAEPVPIRSERVRNLIAASREQRAIVVSSSQRLIAEPLGADELDEALGYLKRNPDHSSYHLLHLIRQRHADSYRELEPRQRARILCSALRHWDYVNDWGHLGIYGGGDGPSGTALLESGRHALAPLLPLLDCADPAPHFGSEEATVSAGRQYRRKDFAYRYIMLILKNEHNFDMDPKRRDERIDALRAELASKMKS